MNMWVAKDGEALGDLVQVQAYLPWASQSLLHTLRHHLLHVVPLGVPMCLESTFLPPPGDHQGPWPASH